MQFSSHHQHRSDHRASGFFVGAMKAWTPSPIFLAAVPRADMLTEVRKRIPPDALAVLSNQHLSQEQAAKLNLRPGDVRLLD
jgi:hypothetical protein